MGATIKEIPTRVVGSANRTYLDHNATSPVRPEVAEAIARALALPGNPSSIHAEGRAARAAIEAARIEVARLVGADPSRILFTSGGTEAANALLSGGLRRAGQTMPTRLLVGASEHACVSGGHRFALEAVEVLPVDSSGLLRLDHLRARLAALSGESLLISIQAANNETGVIQPLAEIVALARTHGRALVHSDAVQAVGRIPFDFEALGLDAVSLSGHKFAGPKGVGAFVLGEGIVLEAAFLRGGGQEARLRGGTENLPGIVGMGEAARLAAAGLDGEAERLLRLRDKAEAGLRALAPNTMIIGREAPRLPNTLAFAIPGLEASIALIAFDLTGMALSSGSACSSGKVGRSATLSAMGFSPALAAGALRVSLGWSSRQDDVAHFLAACERLASSLYHRHGRAA